MGTGANRHQGKWTFGKKGYPKCPKGVLQVPSAHFPQMFTNGRWGEWALRENGHLGEKGTPSVLKGYPKCPLPIFRKCMQMGSEANGHLGQIDIWGKKVPQVPTSALCPFSPNAYKWALGQMNICRKGVPQVPEGVPPSAHFLQMFSNEHWGKWALGANGHLGVRGTPSVLYPFPPNFFPSAHFSRCPFEKIWGKWAQGTCDISLGHLRYPFPSNVQVAIFPSTHMQTFAEMTQGTWDTPLGNLG